MRDLFKILVIGIALVVSPYVSAEQYKVLVIPDNIVTENETVDSYIYNATSEFFANEVVNILNQTDYIQSPTISEERKFLKNTPSNMIPARAVTTKFKTTYNIDFVQLKKIAKHNNARYILLITSSIDAENYILRRTLWDLLNIGGATVVDPAYKICTYTALVDTDSNIVMWSNTFYKTISVVENRIITRGPSPQTEQLQKIRDYSRMLCPEIAQNVQLKVLSSEELNKESNQIYYDMGNFDNVFTKKYRRWHKEGKKDYNVTKTRVDAQINNTKENVKTKYNDFKESQAQRSAERQKRIQEEKLLEQQQKKLEVKAEPIKEPVKEISPKEVESNGIFNINFKKQNPDLEDQSLYEPIEIKKTKKNNLYGDFDNSRPPLRDYN